jgi:hypothetical protein
MRSPRRTPAAPNPLDTIFAAAEDAPPRVRVWLEALDRKGDRTEAVVVPAVSRPHKPHKPQKVLK